MRLLGDASGSVKVSCCVQARESSTMHDILFAVCDKEHNCREPLAWHGMKQDGSFCGHIRACNSRLRKQTARYTIPPKPVSSITVEKALDSERSKVCEQRATGVKTSNRQKVIASWWSQQGACTMRASLTSRRRLTRYDRWSVKLN